MHASPGDWLIVRSARETVHSRRGEILSTAEGGSPPYHVRWLDTGHEGLVFPGPDAEVVTAAHQQELDRAATERATQVQDEILIHHPA